MPRSQKTPTREVLLDLIKPGMIYSPYVLGQKLRAPSADVKKILLALVDEGKLKMIKPHKHQCFMLPNTEHLRHGKVERPALDPATVAQPRTYAVLTGLLSGYDAEIARRQQLCMMVRAR